MTQQPKLAWFNYDLVNSQRIIAIYVDGPVVDLTKVVLLDAHDSEIITKIQNQLAYMADEDYFQAIQHILHAFYSAAIGQVVALPAAAEPVEQFAAA